MLGRDGREVLGRSCIAWPMMLVTVVREVGDLMCAWYLVFVGCEGCGG